MDGLRDRGVQTLRVRVPESPGSGSRVANFRSGSESQPQPMLHALNPDPVSNAPDTDRNPTLHVFIQKRTYHSHTDQIRILSRTAQIRILNRTAKIHFQRRTGPWLFILDGCPFYSTGSGSLEKF